MFYDIQQSGHLWEVSLRYQSDRADFDNLVSACKILGAEWRANTKKWYIASSKMASILQHANVFAKTSEQVMDVVRSKKMELDGAAKMDLSDPDALTPLRMREKGKKLKDYQIEAVKWISERESTLLADEMGLGKGHPVGTKIVVPGGWAAIEDLEIGDSVVGANGHPVELKGIYRRGVLPVYRVSFSDGSSVEVDGDHLWSVRRMAGTKWHTKSTCDLIGNLRDAAGNYTWRIPMTEPIVQFTKTSELPIDPWLLGFLIGDGGLRYGVKFSSDDSEIVSKVKRILRLNYPELSVKHGKGCDYSVTRGNVGGKRNRLKDDLAALGMIGKYSHEKWIPKQYKYANVDARLRMIQGLMDADGYAMPQGGTEFSTSSDLLADDFCEMVESLGGIAKRKKRKTKCRDSWRINAKLPSQFNPFWLPRKALAYVPPTKYPPTRVIRSIEPVGSKEVICLAVGSPDHLYLTEHHIVTHNTVMSAACLNACPDFKKALVICPANLKQNWFNELKDWMVDTSRSIGIVSGSYWPPTDVVIINYDVLDRHKGKLDAITWDFIFQDECHYIKSTKAKRTKAIIGGKIRKKKRGK